MSASTSGFEFPATLRDAHVELHAVTEEHRAPLSAAARCGDSFRYMPVRSGDDGWQETFERLLAMRAQHTGCVFAIRHLACGAWVGASGYLTPDPANRRVEIGFSWLEPAHRGGAANPAAKRLLLGHAFEQLGCERVEFKTDARNALSRRALAKLGAREEGVHRHHMLMPDGHWRDSVYASILRAEWPDVRARLDARLASCDSARCDAPAAEPA